MHKKNAPVVNPFNLRMHPNHSPLKKSSDVVFILNRRRLGLNEYVTGNHIVSYIRFCGDRREGGTGGGSQRAALKGHRARG